MGLLVLTSFPTEHLKKNPFKKNMSIIKFQKGDYICQFFFLATFLTALIFSQTSLLFSKTIAGGKTSNQNIKKLNVVRDEPVRLINNLDINHQYGPKPVYNQRDGDWTATLIDSSLNGYGAYIGKVNPLGFSSSSGYVAAYRQFQGLTSSAGYIGASQSEDGEEWFTEQRLNITYPKRRRRTKSPNFNWYTSSKIPQCRYFNWWNANCNLE